MNHARRMVLLCLFWTMLLISACGDDGGQTTPVNSPPGNPTLTASDSAVTVSWQPAAGATSYNLYWTDNPNLALAVWNKISNVTSPYVHGNLQNGSPYLYKITAVYQSGESAPTNPVGATPNPVTP